MAFQTGAALFEKAFPDPITAAIGMSKWCAAHNYIKVRAIMSNISHLNENFYFLTKIYVYTGATAVLVAQDISFPTSVGVAIIDVSGYISDYLSKQNQFDYDVDNEKDTNIARKFLLEVYEVYTGNDHATYHIYFTGYAVDSANQRLDPNGANMKRFVIYPSIEEVIPVPGPEIIDPDFALTLGGGGPFWIAA